MISTLDFQKRLTRAFIGRNPVVLELLPRVETKTATGGILKTLGETPRPPQIFTLIEPSDSGYREPVKSSTGEQLTIDYLLIGEADAVMDVNDVFIHEEREYKIVTIMVNNSYEKRALVTRHGW